MNNQAAQTMPGGPLSGKYGDVLHPFVIQMERELHANAGKGDRPGWLKMSPEVALLEIYYHLAKLQKAVKDDNGPGIQEYAADVANMSMMLLDICGGLALIEYAAPAASATSKTHDRCTDPENCKRCSEDASTPHAGIPHAAPAASGGEDAFRREWKNRFGFLATKNPPDSIESIDEVAELLRPRQSTPPSAASVSERAQVTQAMLDAGSSAMIEFRKSGGDWTDKPAHAAEVVIRAALEQALTQQRGDANVAEYQARGLDPYSDDVFWGWKKITKDEYDQAERQSAMSSNKLTRIELRKLYTTPQPGAEALRELVQRWRGVIEGAEAMGYSEQEADVMRLMVNELESLLGRGAE